MTFHSRGRQYPMAAVIHTAFMYSNLTQLSSQCDKLQPAKPNHRPRLLANKCILSTRPRQLKRLKIVVGRLHQRWDVGVMLADRYLAAAPEVATKKPVTIDATGDREVSDRERMA